MYYSCDLIAEAKHNELSIRLAKNQLDFQLGSKKK